MMRPRIVIATRKSHLAVQQANWVKQALLVLYPHYTIDLLMFSTQADQWLDAQNRDFIGKGLFVKELESALLTGQADLAVHSMKDMPIELPKGLCLAAICERIEPRDAFISNRYTDMIQARSGIHIGTSSQRRQVQLHAIRADVQISPLRGNIHTRLSLLDSGMFDAIILAAAGLHRVGLMHRIRYYWSVDEILPAAGQGALGIECRATDEHMRTLLTPLNDPWTSACVTAERALCMHLGGGCHIPVGAFAQKQSDHQILLKGMIADQDRSQLWRAEHTLPMQDATILGVRVADQLIQLGAHPFL